jgi:PAS domain S-box-containing protein
MAESSRSGGGPGLTTTPYHDGHYDPAPGVLADGLAGVDGIAVSDVVAMDAAPAVPADPGLPVVFAETAPDDHSDAVLPDAPAVWVTTSGAVATAALDAGALDAFLWQPGDGWGVLAAKLAHVTDRPGTRPLHAADGIDPVERADPDADTIGAEDPELYEYLVKTVGDAVYILDAEGRFSFVNDALCELVGYDRTELLGSSVHVIKDDETVAEAEDALRDLLRNRSEAQGTPIAKLDVDLVTKAGDRIPATDRMTLRPFDDDGELTGTVGTLRDISRQRRREDILGGLLASTQEMVTADTTDAVADQVVRTARDVLDVDLVAVREHDPDAGVLRPVAVSDATSESMPERPVYDVHEGPVGEAFATGEPVVRDVGAIDDDRTRGRVEAAAYLPVGDRRTLSLGRRDGAFTDDERDFAELLATTAASMFDRVERGEELQRYEAVVETAEEYLFTADADGRFTLVTGPLADRLGYDRDALTRRPLDDVFADDSVVADVRDGPTAHSAYETELRARDGERVPCRVSVTPIAGDPASGVVGSVRDITELRSAKREATRQRRRFTELFETLDDPVADIQYTDDGAVVRHVNRAFAALCGDETVEDAALDAVRMVLPDGIASVLDAIEDPQGSVDRRVTAHTHDGQAHYLCKTVPYRGDEGPRAFVILTDVTELERRGTYLSVLQRLLRHNLRTETTVIQGYAQQLTTADDDAVAEAGERITEASESLVATSDTAHTIRQVVQADVGTTDPVRADAFADALADALPARFPDADLAVDAATDRRLRASDHLETAVAELVENALTHAGPDPTVTVSVDTHDDGVAVAVADDGPGLPQAEWDVVAGDREITQLQHTSGLGLWLVKWIVDRHGGRMSLDADADGTTVTLVLPSAD